jgi:hypothetical protein
LYRWPHTGGPITAEELRFEPGGWDHEHCDGCNCTINMGQIFWQTARGSCFWLCQSCFRELRELRRSPPDQGPIEPGSSRKPE